MSMMKSSKKKRYADGGDINFLPRLEGVSMPNVGYSMPGAGYRPGVDPEHNYFPNRPVRTAPIPTPVEEAAPSAPADSGDGGGGDSGAGAGGGMARGGAVKPKKMAKGGAVTRGDGCAARGKTRGRMV